MGKDGRSHRKKQTPGGLGRAAFEVHRVTQRTDNMALQEWRGRCWQGKHHLLEGGNELALQVKVGHVMVMRVAHRRGKMD